MKKILTALLVAATALTPLTAAYAQREGRENVRAEGVERAPRGPEIRQWNRAERRAPEQRQQGEQRQQSENPRSEQRREWRQQQRAEQPRPEQPRQRDGVRSEWRGNNGLEGNRQPRVETPRQDWGNRGGVYDRNRDGNLDRRWDRNRDGTADRNWDRNNNGRVDRQWDRNRDGNLDQRWDRNNNNRVDRRYDRNRDGNLDRRYDYNRDGRADRYGRDNRRYGNSGWNRGWRSDQRYNWQGYRNQYRDHYRLGRYYAPYRDHRYSRFSIGIRIGSPFYSNRYWINDPWTYRLPQVDGPYRWVRYYDDVLLVDIYSGEVVDVIHNFFW